MLWTFRLTNKLRSVLCYYENVAIWVRGALFYELQQLAMQKKLNNNVVMDTLKTIVKIYVKVRRVT